MEHVHELLLVFSIAFFLRDGRFSLISGWEILSLMWRRIPVKEFFFSVEVFLFEMLGVLDLLVS
jgi:hypothetical protein